MNNSEATCAFSRWTYLILIVHSMVNFRSTFDLLSNRTIASSWRGRWRGVGIREVFSILSPLTLSSSGKGIYNERCNQHISGMKARQPFLSGWIFEWLLLMRCPFLFPFLYSRNRYFARQNSYKASCCTATILFPCLFTWTIYKGWQSGMITWVNSCV